MLRSSTSLTPLWLALVVACSGSGGATSPDAGDSRDAAAPTFPPARTDVVAAVGSPTTLDIATWNVENFPRFSTAPEAIADLVASLAVDLVVFQEIQNVEALEEIALRLPGYAVIASAHTYGDGTYQKIAFLYRTDVVSVDQPALMFQNNTYEFPRPPFKARVEVVASGLDFDLIGLHLKAGFANEDEERRQQALSILEASVRSSIDGSGDDDVIVLGDFNDTIDGGAHVLGTWLTATERYRFRTQALADAGAYSFIPSETLIDHIVTSAALDDDLGGSTTAIPDLEASYDGYLTVVSDHLPVILSAPL